MFVEVHRNTFARREEAMPLLVSHLAFGAALPSASAGDGVTSGAAATAGDSPVTAAARAAEAAAEAAEAAMETAVAAAAAAEVAAAAARSRSPAAAKRKLERSISTPAVAERLPDDPLTADSPAAAWYRQRKLKKVRNVRILWLARQGLSQTIRRGGTTSPRRQRP